MEGLDNCYSVDKDRKDTNNMSSFDRLKYNVTCNFKANGYRLPTEVEWEYAANGGNKSIGYEYSGSDNIEEVAESIGTPKEETYSEYVTMMEQYIDDFGYKKLLV